MAINFFATTATMSMALVSATGEGTITSYATTNLVAETSKRQESNDFI